MTKQEVTALGVEESKWKLFREIYFRDLNLEAARRYNSDKDLRDAISATTAMIKARDHLSSIFMTAINCYQEERRGQKNTAASAVNTDNGSNAENPNPISADIIPETQEDCKA